MKKQILIFLCIVLVSISSYSFDDSFKVGGKLATDGWELMLKDNNDISKLDQCKGKVLILYHIDPKHRNDNIDAIYAVRNAIVDGRLTLSNFQSIGIVDCDATWQPNSMIKKFAEKENEKMPKLHSILLFDYKGMLVKKYSNEDDGNLNCILLVDKNEIIRAIYRNIMTKAQIKELVDTAVKLQNEPYKQ